MPQTKLAIDPLAHQTPDPHQLPQNEALVDSSIQNEAAGYASPIPPAFSPITPKSHPVFPVTHPPPAESSSLPPRNDSTIITADAHADSPPRIAPAEYIPQPPPRPFSREDSADAIALRAAISSLQFQRKKAQEDIKALESVRRKALEEPELFKSELAAGRLKEQKNNVGDLRAIFDADSEEEDEDGEEMQVDSSSTTAAPFETIPGPQNVVRMPNINWEKYHIDGEALDRLHEQQRRWPGSFDYGSRTGRQFAVAAPYSPWQDTLETQDGRKDSHAASGIAASGIVSEHPMETRRGARH